MHFLFNLQENLNKNCTLKNSWHLKIHTEIGSQKGKIKIFFLSHSVKLDMCVRQAFDYTSAWYIFFFFINNTSSAEGYDWLVCPLSQNRTERKS